MKRKSLIDIKRGSSERAFLVAVEEKKKAGRQRTDSSLDELARLADTAGAEVVGRMSQRLPVASKNYYLGEGKLAELLSHQASTNYNVVIFDDELSPLQQRNLENYLNVKVIDRVTLILDIFAGRAQTREGQLQVELAQHQYLYPRLAGQWSHLERLGGGIGTRGPGESQIETDRRLIQKKIHRLQSQTEQISKQRLLYRQKRRKNHVPIVALVGYTNAGKSTLLNAMSKADVSVENKLFVTLDPTTRRLALPDNSSILMTDTVGFIRKLPPAIVNSFRATLEELSEASMLVHVVDFSSSEASDQCQAVEDVLDDLGLTNKPRITALNKIDLLPGVEQDWNEEDAINYFTDRALPTSQNTVLISASKKWGFKELRELISRISAQYVVTV
ncbi:GTPase HflX [Chloroflexota bacterium]